MKRLQMILRNDKKLIAFCYAAFFLVSVLACVYGWAEDGVRRALGQVTPQTLTVEDFTLTDLEVREDGTLFATTPDPRMTLNEVPQYVRTIRVKGEFLNKDPGEFCVFYKPRPGMEEFDAGYRVWATRDDDGTYVFTLPRGRIYGLRLDPGIYSGLTLRLDEIVCNAPQSVLSRFAPSRTWLLCQLAVPMLLAALCKMCREAWDALRPRLQKKRGTV